MRVAIECAGFTPSEADQLRRSMATFKFTGGVSKFRDKLITGMIEQRLRRRLCRAHLQAARRLRLLRLSGEPRRVLRADRLCLVLDEVPPSGRRSAARILNAQPMGFYAPAQLVRDARQHGVEVRPVDVNHSRWDCTLEPLTEGRLRGAARPAARQGAREQGWRHDRRSRAARAVRVGRGPVAARGACRSPPSNASPMPTPSARSASTAATRSGRSAA